MPAPGFPVDLATLIRVAPALDEFLYQLNLSDPPALVKQAKTSTFRVSRSYVQWSEAF